MNKKEFTAFNFISERLLDFICILESDEKHHSYKIIGNKKTFTLIAKFGAKNEETMPLKNSASAQKTARYQDKKQVSSEDKLCKQKRKRGKKISSPRASAVESASQHSDKNQDSSNVGQAEQPKLKKKKTPAQVARDSARRKAFWKRTKVTRRLKAENFAAHFAKLQDTKTLASPQFSVASDPEISWPCLDSTTVKAATRSKVTAVSQQTCLDTNSSVSAVKHSSILLKNSEDSEIEGNHDLPERTETNRNEPKRTETDFRGYRNGLTGYRNGLLWIPKRTGTDRNGLSWIPKRTFWVPKRTLVDTKTDSLGTKS